MGRLTAKIVEALERPGRYGDGGTLYLVVAPGGSKSWVQRLTIGGRRRDLGLGGFPLVLADSNTLQEPVERIRGRAFNRSTAASGATGNPVRAQNAGLDLVAHLEEQRSLPAAAVRHAVVTDERLQRRRREVERRFGRQPVARPTARCSR